MRTRARRGNPLGRESRREMADLNDVAELMRRWIDDEYAIETAIWTERDQEKLKAMIDALNQRYNGRGLRTHLQRTRASEGHFARAGDMLPGLAARTLFRVERRSAADGTPLFAAYVSSTRTGNKDLFSRYFLVELEQGLRMVSQYNLCGECGGTGKVGGRTCGQCGGEGWNQRGGIPVTNPGPVEEQQDFAAPDGGWPA
jgi:RecJ-like exonuclease